MRKIVDSVLDLIGMTPMVRLKRLGAGLPGEILVKLEYFSPGGSVKDRAALWCIEGAEREGLLKPGDVVVEATSGNMGAGLAIACAIKGYHMVAVMSETMSEERKQMLRTLGAELVLIPVSADEKGKIALKDYELATNKAAQIAEERGGLFVDQFHNPYNLQAHYESTGREIWEQTDGRVDIFVAMAGSAGTVMGVARAIKERNPKIKVIVGEPATSAVIAGNPPGEHRIMGVGPGFVPSLYDPKLCDGLITVTDEEAKIVAQMLARKEGIFAGYSSGANVAAALKLARQAEPGQVIVTIVCDTGLKYISTDLFTD